MVKNLKFKIILVITVCNFYSKSMYEYLSEFHKIYNYNEIKSKLNELANIFR